MHPVFAVATPQDVRPGAAYFRELARLATQHGFGSLAGSSASARRNGRRAGGRVPVELLRPGKREKATLSENAGTRTFLRC